MLLPVGQRQSGLGISVQPLGGEKLSLCARRGTTKGDRGAAGEAPHGENLPETEANTEEGRVKG